MPNNYKHLYEQMKTIVEMYQDELVPGLRKKIEELERELKKDQGRVADMRELAEEVVYQFGYYGQRKGRLHIFHGGLSTLEHAFDVLGWDNPHPVPECECEIEGCHEHATCGAPTSNGYKRMCSRHYGERGDAP